MGMWLAIAFSGLGCDKFFDVRGVLYECNTKTPLAGAQGVATAAGHTGATQFTTDAAGVFVIHMNAPEDADVSVTITKPGYADLYMEYRGMPADADHVELCLTRAP